MARLHAEVAGFDHFFCADAAVEAVVNLPVRDHGADGAVLSGEAVPVFAGPADIQVIFDVGMGPEDQVPTGGDRREGGGLVGLQPEDGHVPAVHDESVVVVFDVHSGGDGLNGHAGGEQLVGGGSGVLNLLDVEVIAGAALKLDGFAGGEGDDGLPVLPGDGGLPIVNPCGLCGQLLRSDVGPVDKHIAVLGRFTPSRGRARMEGDVLFQGGGQGGLGLD